MNPEDYMDPYSPPGTKVTVSSISIKNGRTSEKNYAEKYLAVGEIYTIERTEVFPWYTHIWLKELPGVKFSSVQFVKYVDPLTSVYKMDGQAEIGKAMFNVDILRKRKGQLDAEQLLREQLSKIDVVRIIDDLYHGLHWCTVELNELNEKHGQDERINVQIQVCKDAVQNAEAALGLLQSVKEKGSIGEELRPIGAPFIPPLKDGRPLKIITEQQRNRLIESVASMLPSNPVFGEGKLPPNIYEANAIIYAVEEMLKLKGL